MTTRTLWASSFVLATLLCTPLARAADAAPASASASASIGGGGAGGPADAPPSDASKDGLLYEKGGLAEIGLVVGGKLGGGFSQPFGSLGTSFVGELELGYTLPPLKRSIEIFVAGQYASPKTEGHDIADTYGPSKGSRIPGKMSYDLTEQQAVVTLGGLYRIPLSIPLFRPYVALGGRMYMLRTTVTGTAGTQDFGSNDETAMKFGFYGALGGELHFGPGAVLLEVQTGYASVDGFVLRDTNVGALNVAVGYRLFI
jgi:hypothetical protein